MLKTKLKWLTYTSTVLGKLVSTENRDEFEDDDEIEQLLMAKERETTVVQRVIALVLDAYAREAHLKCSENILHYWASMTATDPDLQKQNVHFHV